MSRESPELGTIISGADQQRIHSNSSDILLCSVRLTLWATIGQGQHTVRQHRLSTQSMVGKGRCEITPVPSRPLAVRLQVVHISTLAA